MNSNSNIAASYLKKGQPEDILLELDEKAQKLHFFQKFLDFVMEEKFLLRFSPMENKNLINFYLSTSKNKRKNKVALLHSFSQNDMSPKSKSKSGKQSEKVNKGLESILYKYVQPSQDKMKPIPLEESKCEMEIKLETTQKVITQKELAENFVLKMTLLVVDPEIFSDFYEKDLEKIGDDLQKLCHLGKNLKNFLLLQGMENFFTSNNFKRKMKKNLTNSANKNEENSDLSDSHFNEWLSDVVIIHNFEYQLTDTINDSVEYLKHVISSIILTKYKDLVPNLLGKENTHTEKSKISGFDSQFSLIWIDILMAIPGVSEDKAIAIVKNYPSMRSLMKMLDESTDEEAENQLKNLQIYYNYNQTKSKNLGVALASKIVKIFKEKDPNKSTKE